MAFETGSNSSSGPLAQLLGEAAPIPVPVTAGAMAVSGLGLSGNRSFGSLRGSPTSSTSSLLDTGHAFEWPVPRATSTNALTDMDSNLTDASSALALSDLTLEHCLAAEHAFVNVLLDIGERLRRFPTKDMRRTLLFGELSLLNLNLPARVYLPLSIGGMDDMGAQSGRLAADPPSTRSASVCSHHVVRIPPQEALTLNSKDRAPYMIQVEVVDCDDFYASPLPPKLTVANKVRGGHKRSMSEGGAKFSGVRRVASADEPVPLSGARYDRTRTISGPTAGFGYESPDVAVRPKPTARMAATKGSPLCTDASASLMPAGDPQQMAAVVGSDAADGQAVEQIAASDEARPLTSDDAATSAHQEGAEKDTAAESLEPSPTYKPSDGKTPAPTPGRSASFTSRWFGWFRGRSSAAVATPAAPPTDAVNVEATTEAASEGEERASKEHHASHPLGADGEGEGDGEAPLADNAASDSPRRRSLPAPLQRPTSGDFGGSFDDDQRTPVASPNRSLASRDSDSHQHPDTADVSEISRSIPEEDVSSNNFGGHVTHSVSSDKTLTGQNSSRNTPVCDDEVAASGDADEEEEDASSSVSVKDIRSRLSAASNTPESQFQRGHADPSAVRAKEPWTDKVRRSLCREYVA
jgi:hypothetical protein